MRFLLPLAIVPLALATGTRPPLDPCSSIVTPFTDVGCYADASGDALIYRSPSDQQDMTVDQCIAECKGNGFRYAGLKYYGVCYCGSSLATDKVDDSLCTLPCTGDQEQVCGGNDQLSVWKDPTFTDVKDVTAEYEPLGCYFDDAPLGRALSFPVSVLGGSLTTETCLDACKDLGFAYAGTEYGSECWCGTNIGIDNIEVDDAECAIPCQGDSSLTCGGRSHLNLYYLADLESSEPCGIAPPVTTTTTTTSIPTTTTTFLDTTPVVTTTTTTSMPTTTTTFLSTPSVITTTTTSKPTTTTTSLCTATSTIPPTCEFQCGKWCAPPLPDWTDKSSCYSAAKTCALQVASCFKTAGWPAAMECFEFGKWCTDVEKYCKDCRSCSKKDCFKKTPGGIKPPTVTTIITPCPTSITTMTATPTTSCAPEPTNICTQPSNDRWGYGPEKPVAGIPLQVVGCNDMKSDFSRNPFKFYNSADSHKCPSFSWPQRPDVCVDVCKEQYEDCKETYVKGCGSKGWHKERTWGKDNDKCATSDSRREWDKKDCDVPECWGKGANDQGKAEQRCKAQLLDCLAVNKKVNPGSHCQQWCQ